MPKKRKAAADDAPEPPVEYTWYCQNDGYKLPEKQALDPGRQTECPKHDGEGWWAVEPPPVGGWEKWDGAIASTATRIPDAKLENAHQKTERAKAAKKKAR